MGVGTQESILHYEGLFTTDRGDKGLTTDISRSVQCRICEATVPRVCMRTHVGQHLLRKECVQGQEEISLATACGFCGDRVTCSTQVVMRNKRTHALVTLMISDCPSQPAKLRWNTLANRSASSPCTNHPVRCPLCTKTVWSYCMAQHYAQSDAAASSAPGDVASSSSSLPPQPKPPAPPLPSESEATTSGAERSRPLKSVGKRTRRGGTKPNGSFIRSAPAETPPRRPQRGSFSRTSKQKSIHFFF